MDNALRRHTDKEIIFGGSTDMTLTDKTQLAQRTEKALQSMIMYPVERSSTGIEIPFYFRTTAYEYQVSGLMIDDESDRACEKYNTLSPNSISSLEVYNNRVVKKLYSKAVIENPISNAERRSIEEFAVMVALGREQRLMGLLKPLMSENLNNLQALFIDETILKCFGVDANSIGKKLQNYDYELAHKLFLDVKLGQVITGAQQSLLSTFPILRYVQFGVNSPVVECTAQYVDGKPSVFFKDEEKYIPDKSIKRKQNSKQVGDISIKQGDIHILIDE